MGSWACVGYKDGRWDDKDEAIEIATGPKQEVGML